MTIRSPELSDSSQLRALARFDDLARRQLAAERSPIATAITTGPLHEVNYLNPAFVQQLASPALDNPEVRATLDDAFANGSSAAVTVQLGSDDFTLLAEAIIDQRGKSTGLAVHVMEHRLAAAPTIAIGRTPTDESALLAINERLVIAAVRELELTDQARQRANELEALFSNMSEGVAVFGMNSQVILTNRKGCAMLGLPDTEADLDDYRELDLRAADGSPIELDRLLVELFGGAVVDRALVLHTSGELRHLILNGQTVKDAQGNATLAIVVFRDVTALRNLERVRERYVALLSHDLRGPLQVATMAADMMVLEAPVLARLGDRLIHNLREVDRMIKDLLETQRLHDVAPVNLEMCDLADTARSVVADLAMVYGQQIELVGDDHAVGVFSESEIRRALWNLVSNALKYGDPSTPVVVTVSDRRTVIRLSVHNRGPAIPMQGRERLFTPFSRGAASDQKPHGWGLGLAMVQGCALAHGGQILLDSDETAGTTFTLELPRRT